MKKFFFILFTVMFLIMVLASCGKTEEAEFWALLKKAEVQGEQLILTMDRIEEREFEDDAYDNGGVYDNETEDNEIVLAHKDIKIAVGYDLRELNADELAEYNEKYEGGMPFRFCAVDGKVVSMTEIMVP